MKVKIIRARKKDAEAFQKVRLATWRNAYAHIFPEEVFKQQEENLPEYIKNTPERFKNQYQYYYVALVDDKVVGMLAVMQTSNYERYKSLGYADLEGIYILPKYQNLGIGTKFFNLAIKTLLKNDATKMVIGVLKENHQARAAYEKWGGVLDDYEQPFVKLEKNYAEVFYKFEPLSAFAKSNAQKSHSAKSK